MVKDLTLAEIKLLRRSQRYEGKRPLFFDNKFPPMSLQEAVDLVKKCNKEFKRDLPMGIEIELKNTDYYKTVGIDIN